MHDQQASPYGQQGVNGINFGGEYQNSMNHIGTYNPNDVHQSNMATTHAHPPTSGPGLGSHYSSYPAPIMPSQHAYPATTYQSYAYPAYSGAPVSASMSNGMVAQPQQLTSEF